MQGTLNPSCNDVRKTAFQCCFMKGDGRNKMGDAEGRKKRVEGLEGT